MPRLSCKSKSLILSVAIAASSLHCALAAEADSASGGPAPGSLPFQVKLDLGTGAAEDLARPPTRGGPLDSSLLLQVPQPASELSKPLADRAPGVIERALALVGVTYRRGGNNPESGLDCSGLVRLVFHDVTGLELPRRAIEISQLGQRVNPQDLQPGDLLFFNTVRRTISHVGIYLGDGQFIHAPASGGRVRIESMALPYWVKHFSIARRVSDSPEGSAQ